MDPQSGCFRPEGRCSVGRWDQRSRQWRECEACVICDWICLNSILKDSGFQTYFHMWSVVRYIVNNLLYIMNYLPL